MTKIETLTTPIIKTVPGGVMTLTHKCTSITIDPRKTSDAVSVKVMYGFIFNGEFQDYGDPEIETLDREGLESLVADTKGGKKAGEFSTAHILPAIEKRKQQKAQAGG